jgi:drug/metabolite transporter (DMT)-like permease
MGARRVSDCDEKHSLVLDAKTPHREGVVDWLLLILPGTIWGASFLLIAEGLDALRPNGVTFVRIAVGFVTLSLIPAARRPMRRADWGATAVLGVVWLAFPLSMFPFAEQHVSSALTGMLNGAMPLFAAAVASIIARRMPSRMVRLGLAVGLAGAILIALPGVAGATGSPEQTLGVLLIVAALVSYGVGVNLARPLQQRNGALPVVWRALGVALVLTAPLGVPDLLDARWTPRAAASLLALGAFGTAVAHVLTATAAGRMGATTAAATTFLIPVVALVLGVAVRHERVAWISIVGAAICLAGAWVIRQARVAEEREFVRSQTLSSAPATRTQALS